MRRKSTFMMSQPLKYTAHTKPTKTRRHYSLCTKTELNHCLIGQSYLFNYFYIKSLIIKIKLYFQNIFLRQNE